MRFILTQHGESLVKVIGEEHANNSSNLAKTMQLNYSKSNYNTHKNNQSKNKSPYQKKYFKPSHSHTKIIEVHPKKLNIPKTINEKYNIPNSNDNSSLILPELPKSLNSRNRNSTVNFENSGSFMNNQSEIGNLSTNNGFKLIYSLRNVIQDKTYLKMRKDVQSLQKEKDMLTKIDENKFRSIYKERSELEDVENLLENTKLDTGKVSLIQYLNTKDNISHQFIKTLSQADDDKINKINKYCQIIANENEMNDIRNNIMKNKIRNKYIKDKNDCKELFSGINQDIDMFKRICDDYNKTYNPSRKERYFEYHKDIQKNFWNKYNVDVLQRKSNFGFQNNNSSFNENPIINENRKK